MVTIPPFRVFPATAMGKSKLLIKEAGVLAGIEVAKEIFNRFDPYHESGSVYQ